MHVQSIVVSNEWMDVDDGMGASIVFEVTINIVHLQLVVTKHACALHQTRHRMLRVTWVMDVAKSVHSSMGITQPKYTLSKVAHLHVRAQVEFAFRSS